MFCRKDQNFSKNSVSDVKFGFLQVMKYGKIHVAIWKRVPRSVNRSKEYTMVIRGDKTMIRIGICDDIYDARIQLRAALERVLESRGPQGSFVEFSSGEQLLRWLASHRGELDVLFLDIKMSGIDGMETAERIREADDDLELVFVTCYSDRVFDGYSVGALAYLMKPAKSSRLEPLVDRILSKLSQNENNTYFCKYGDVTYRIPYKKILYFYSERRTVTCVTAEREYLFYDKLDQVASRLGKQFVRIHQRYLVYAPAVERISTNEVYIGGKALPVSRSRRESTLIALTRASLED